MRPGRTFLALVASAGAAVTCDLPTEPPAAVEIVQAEGWPDTLAVTESTVVRVVVHNVASGQAIAGIDLTWVSENPGILDVVRSSPLGDPLTAADSLRAALAATIQGRSPGVARVAVRLAGQGFAPTTRSFPVTVTPLALEAPLDRAWPDTLTVTDTALVEVQIRDAHGSSVRDVRVSWRSSDPQIFGVLREEADESDVTPEDTLNAHRRASVIARRTGRADILVTVERDGFAPSEERHTVESVPFVIEESSPWPSRISITDTVVLALQVVSFDNRPLQGRIITWSNPPGALVDVVPLGTGDSVRVVGRVSGVASILGTVDPSGFQPADFARALAVSPLVLSEPPDTPWPDTLMVADTATLQLAVQDVDGNARPGRDVRWEVTNPSRLEVTTLSGPDNPGRVAVAARGSASIQAIVGLVGFEQDTLVQSITLLERWVAVSAGEDHTCAIAFALTSAQGPTYCWGANTRGAFGNGTTVGSAVPVAVGGGAAAGVFGAVRAGQESTCGIQAGLLRCWGRGSDGRLGSGSEEDELVPVSTGRSFPLFSPGGTTCGIDERSVVFCWGLGDVGQLGSLESFTVPFDRCVGDLVCSVTPRAARWPPADSVFARAIDVGERHVCAISAPPLSDSLAFCWGSGSLESVTFDSIYVLGHPDEYQSDTAVAVSTALRFRSVTVGLRHTCALTGDGDAYCWGWNANGQLGDNSTADKRTPSAVAGGLQFEGLTAGQWHTCGLQSDGTAHCWGHNGYGQLGIASTPTADALVPQPVLGGVRFVGIEAGAFHTCGVTEDGVVLCWGRNRRDELGSLEPMMTCTVGGVASPCSPVPVRVAEPGE